MLTVEQLQSKIVNVVVTELKNSNSNLYNYIKGKVTERTNELIVEDSVNDIRWDTLDGLFDNYTLIGNISSENNFYYLNIDDTKLTSGQYTLKYIDENKNALTNFAPITTFTI